MAAGKKDKGEEFKVDPNGWMITFADLLMLLLTFFVLLLTMKSMDGGTVKKMFDSFLSTGPLQYSSADAEVGPFNVGTVKFRKPDKIENSDLLEEAMALLQDFDSAGVDRGQMINVKDILDIKEDERGVYISLDSDHLFNSGSAQLRHERLAILERIARFLRYTTNDILIMGHTDNVPLRSAVFRSNKELSYYRALSALYFITDSAGIKPRRVAVGGYGELAPRFANDSKANRAKNRRVEFILRKSTG